jgi:hypothetical protein
MALESPSFGEMLELMQNEGDNLLPTNLSNLNIIPN